MSVLTDKYGLPRVLFHFSRHDIPNFEFRPLTHFGTCQAAHERWCGTGSSNPDTRFYPVLLKMKNPIRVTDSSDLDIRIDPRELMQAGLSRQDTHYIFQPLVKSAISKNDFDTQADKNHCYGPFHFNPKPIEKIQNLTLKKIFTTFGLHSETVFPLADFEVHQELKRQWSDNPRRDLAMQRLEHTLRDNGFDGIVYKNREEDYGKDSFCILSPDQVISYFDYDFEGRKPTIKPPREGYKYAPADSVYDPSEWNFPGLALR